MHHSCHSVWHLGSRFWPFLTPKTHVTSCNYIKVGDGYSSNVTACEATSYLILNSCQVTPFLAHVFFSPDFYVFSTRSPMDFVPFFRGVPVVFNVLINQELSDKNQAPSHNVCGKIWRMWIDPTLEIIYIWWFPKIGVPPVLILISNDGRFPFTKTILIRY